MANGSALVLFSGGQDSTVCLAWALERYEHVETVGFAYGQRHAAELRQRPVIRRALADCRRSWEARLKEDHVLDLQSLGAISATALTRDEAITVPGEGGRRLPNTFVPGRNLLFFTYAAALAYPRAIHTLVGGMCETDYSGYPDCRAATLEALNRALELGMDAPFAIETPLMHIDKAGTWALAERLGGASLVAIIVEHAHTCYLGERALRHAWGLGCGACPACSLRARGWEQWQATKLGARK
jgi:7-cyano-7-deazaguanine synthase